MKRPWNVKWTPFEGNYILSKYVYDLYPSSDKQNENDRRVLWSCIACPYRKPNGWLINQSLVSDRKFYGLPNANQAKAKLLHQFKIIELHQELYKVALHPSRFEWLF